MTCHSLPGACPGWRSSWSPRGGRRHQPRGPAGPAPRGGRHLSTAEKLGDFQGPGLRGEEGPDRAPVRDHRREVTPDGGEPEVIFYVDEFGPLNLQPPPGRQWAAVSGKGKERGREPRRPAAPPIPVPPGYGTCSPPMSWARTSCSGPLSRARPGPGSWSLPLPTLPLPARGPDRDRLLQLQPAPDNGRGRPGRGLGDCVAGRRGRCG